MYEIMKNLTKAGKKDFNKLTDEEKASIIHANVTDKIGDVLTKAITDATIRGIEMAYEQIYKEFVKPIDENEGNKTRRQAYMNSLLSQIRLKHLEYEKKRRTEENG